MRQELVTELKGIIEDILNKLYSVINLNFVSDKMAGSISRSYRDGIEEMELKLDMNFFEEREKLQFLNDYTFDNIADMNDEVKGKLRAELSRAIINKESVESVKERVSKVMDVAATRARMIARTELNRAENQGRMDAAEQSGLKIEKYVDATLDSRTSDICRHMQRSYGTKDKSIQMPDKFRYKDQEWDAPPFHPNCRSVVLFEQKGLSEEELE